MMCKCEDEGMGRGGGGEEVCRRGRIQRER